MEYLEQSRRPWGEYQKFFQQDDIWVKRIVVNPQGRLSLQKHQHRSEKWIIVSGQGLAIVDGQEIPVKAGEVVDIPLGCIHRIGNTGKDLLVFIEIAFGKHLSEDDIIRLQDDYTR